MPRFPVEDPAGPAPDFLKFRGKTFTKTFSVVRQTVNRSKIATVCEEAKCPNRTECWSGGTATFMLMGDTCTRGCKFCAVKTSARPDPLDPIEPENLAIALDDWDLNYIVLTSVDRDDLPDGGAAHLADCIRAVKTRHPDIRIEILIPDFQGDPDALRQIVEARPDVIAHNIETVERLTPFVRDRRATYSQTLEVLSMIKEMDPKMLTKSSIMIGLSEQYEEVITTMKDLREVDVDFLTIGQYMRPTLKHLPVKEYVEQDTFDRYESEGSVLGFLYTIAKPLVRSSYRAGELFIHGYLEDRD
ncbi:MAG: lipoyl synthase [Candidatus Kariarchaeaceae archaeon]